MNAPHMHIVYKTINWIWVFRLIFRFRSIVNNSYVIRSYVYYVCVCILSNKYANPFAMRCNLFVVDSFFFFFSFPIHVFREAIEPTIPKKLLYVPIDHMDFKFFSVVFLLFSLMRCYLKWIIDPVVFIISGWKKKTKCSVCFEQC